MKIDRQALIVYAVYKSKMIHQSDAETECEVGPRGLKATRVKSGVKDYSKEQKPSKQGI